MQCIGMFTKIWIQCIDIGPYFYVKLISKYPVHNKCLHYNPIQHSIEQSPYRYLFVEMKDFIQDVNCRHNGICEVRSFWYNLNELYFVY